MEYLCRLAPTSLLHYPLSAKKRTILSGQSLAKQKGLYSNARSGFLLADESYFATPMTAQSFSASEAHRR